MTNALHPVSRTILLLSVLSMVSCYFIPLWEIQLWAPQYPEGLNMKIWINHLSGAFDIINGLNHYIGMATINEAMFPEFRFMGYLLAILIAIGVFTAWRGNRRWLWWYVGILVGCGVAGLADFFRWGWQYGHNLNPNAPIRVPGMTYQPPVIGYKNLLNFTAYSGPEAGGWVLIICGFLAAAILGWEQFLRGRDLQALAVKWRTPFTTGVASLVVASWLSGCEVKPEPVRYGQDECAECRMIISDQRFGAELLTRKGRVYKFDDLCCMKAFVKRGAVLPAEVKVELASDFQRPNQFLPVTEAYLLVSDQLKSPMGSDCAAFASEAARQEAQAALGGGKPVRWAELPE